MSVIGKNLFLQGAEVLGGVDHVDQGGLCLLPLAGLKTAVGVNPELVWAEIPFCTLVLIQQVFARRRTHSSISVIRSLISCSLGIRGE
jgi:hypothetical protein